MLLKLNNISVSYGPVLAVDDVSLEIEDGEQIALLGANGAGKSTILRAISSLICPLSGEIWFKDRRIDQNTSPSEIVEMGISHVPEGRQLFPYLSVEKNLLMGAYLRKNKLSVKRDLDKLYRDFPILSDRRNQTAGSMSGGEQQLVAICRSLMSKPILLLMDEPSIGLSPILVDQIAVLINDINKLGISVLLVEQNASVALEISDRAYVLENGKIIISGKSNDLLTNSQVKSAYLGL